MNREEELALLRRIEMQAARLLDTPDALMAGQYRHLHGRISALIAILTSTPQERAFVRENDHAETDGPRGPDHGSGVGPR
jgi:hypothetical protein